MPLYTYEGQTYNLDEGLSNEQAIETIQSHLQSAGISPSASGPVAEDEEPIVQQRPTSPTQESTTQEIGEGIASGLIAIPQGIAELGAAGADLIFDTNYAQDVTDFADGVRAMAGIDPEGAAGEIAEVVTQFVIPGLGAAGAVSKLSRLRNVPKMTQRLAQVGAAGVTDAVVATDGVTTLGDFFGGGVTQTTDTVGLQGREAAAAKIGNKIKVGLEAMGATAAVDPILKALGYGGRAAVKVATPITAPVAGVVSKATKAIGEQVQKIADEHELVDRTLSAFRFRGNLSSELAEVRSRISGELDAETGQVARTLVEMQDTIDLALKNGEQVLGDASPLTKESALNSFWAYLTKDEAFMANAKAQGVPALKMLPQSMQSAARKGRVQVDRLSKQILKSDYLTRESLPNAEAKAAEIIKDQLGSYMRRRYKIFEDSKYLKSGEFTQARKDTIDYFMRAPSAAKNIIKELEMETAFDDAADFLVEGGREVMTRDAAERITDAYVANYSGKATKPKGSPNSQTVAQNRLRTGLFQSKQANNQQLRALLGEIKDPQEALVTTVADMAEFVATDRFYKFINENLIDDSSGMFLSPEAFSKLPKQVRDAEYTLLGEGFGALKDTVYARNNVYKDLTMQTTANTNDVANVMRASYSAFLKGKGITQYAATVLSPVTQVRNVTSSALFALAQGNVGAGANLFDSMSVVYDNVLKKPDRNRYYKNLQRIGVVGTQTQIKEMDKLIVEGYGLTQKAQEDALGMPILTASKTGFAQTLKNGKAASVFGATKSANSLARDLYQGGDDIWKIYNFEFEKNKILSALGSEDAVFKAFGKSSDQYSADIVKNTVPNYERVPLFVKELRKLPVGNFIAFPAEILRTSANTLKQSLDELSVRADDPDFLAKFGGDQDAAAAAAKKINEIGTRRLMGFTTTTMVVPTAMQKMAMDLTGVTQEQMDAIRENGADWEKDAILLPSSVKVDSNGKTQVTGYINYSFTNPYAYLAAPARAILNAVSKGQDMGSDTSKIATDAVMGAMKNMFAPFGAESILTERIVDATFRGGVTRSGSKVYRDEVDSPGDKVLKSFAHISNAFVPGVAKLAFEIKGQKKETQAPGFEMGRLVRAFADNTVDPSGNERHIAQEVFRALTGITETEVKPDNILMFRGFEYGRQVQTASQIFNSAVSTRGALDPENAVQTYIDANEARFRVMNEMYRTIKNMENMGISRYEIRRSLKKNGVPNARELMKGKFVPFEPSSDIKKRVRQNGNRLPMSEINAIRRTLRQRKLGEAPAPETQEQEPTTMDLGPVTPVQSQPVAAGTVPPSVPAQAGAVPAPQSAPASSSVRNNPAFMGGDPFSALKNMQTFGNN
jgi:hypothetical protein